MAKKADSTETTTSDAVFLKEQIYESKKYRNCKDIVEAILEDDKEYTIKEVDALIEEFRGKVVN